MIKVDKTVLDPEIVEVMKEQTKDQIDYAYEFVNKLRFDLQDRTSSVTRLDARKNIKKTVSDYRDTFSVFRLHMGEDAWDSFIAELETENVPARTIGDIKRFVNQDMRRFYDKVKSEDLSGMHVFEDVTDFTVRYDRTAKRLYVKVI